MLDYEYRNFVDTSVWFDAFISGRPATERLRPLLRAHAGKLITTDHILCELFNLIRARLQMTKCSPIWELLNDPAYVSIISTTSADLTEAFQIYQKFADKDWSFTDCLSYHFIRAFRIPIAFSLDHHFHEFGIVSVLPGSKLAPSIKRPRK